ncbi:MAG: tetratricopeptide repeat protein [Bacteroidales bacterium]|nr:tetratricopeptide repeat protein [Bacteroidales bacterium]
MVVLTVALNVQAQYPERVLKAFEQSYVLEKNRDFKGAAATLTTVYQADSYEINLRLGWLQYNVGRFDDSKRYYRKALSLMPYSEEARFGLILPLAARGEWQEVATLYQQIITHNPGNTRALYQLGRIHYNKREWAIAAKLFQKVVDLYPFDYDGLLMLAWSNVQLGKTREARVLFNKVLLWSPSDASALEGLKLLK